MTTAAAPYVDRRVGVTKVLKTLIWAYFLLLIFEGSLRMLLPSLSNALLVVRDPFLLIAYAVALISGVFPWNRFVIAFWLLGLFALFLALFQWPQFPLVALYGFRSAFLHIPFIFLMATVMDELDVLAMGKWFLLLSVPIAILMAVQFQAGPDSWLNRGLDNQFRQIGTNTGKIRPPGTFTYILGPILFFGFVTAFALYEQFRKGTYAKALIWTAIAAVCLGLAVSVSRSALGSVGFVLTACVIGVFASRPAKLTGIVKFAMVVGAVLIVLSQLPVFDEGRTHFSMRIESTVIEEGGLEGFLHRSLYDFASAYRAIERAEVAGTGLGTGSNVGAMMLTGRAGFLLAEGEWSRMILELGPFIGVMFLAMRVGLVLWLASRSIWAARQGSLLPILLLGATATSIISGIWSQPTALGFTVLGGGLCLAAMPKGRRVSQTLA